MPQFEDEHKCEVFEDNWIFTYGDLVTLLLCFFVLLFSFCKLDIEKFRSVADSFKPVPAGSPFFLSGKPELLEEMAKQIETSEIADEVFVTVDERGVVVSFKDTVLFDSGSANLKKKGERILTQFSQFLFGLPNDVVVEGHTDNQPIRSVSYPSNWELSSARASSVARFFESEGIKGHRMNVVGYGPHKPRFRNDTPEKRALNRRVDIILKPD
ncbi:MAG: OmpA family protein [Deltaproteobacteria bacterium]|nr:OmpA family protein [Deltaproteobacteria bacterium]